MMRSLEQIFLKTDPKARMRLQTEFALCQMKVGESLLVFLGRVNLIINELGGMGDKMDEQGRIVAITTKLRPFLRAAAEEKIDREPEISYRGMVQYLLEKQKDEREVMGAQQVFVAAGGQRGVVIPCPLVNT